MAERQQQQQQQHTPGGYYSGRNKVPNIQQFVENLDKDKRERDKHIEEERREKEAHARGEARPHKPQQYTVKESQKTVTDPVTGKEVLIEDVNESMMKQVQDPTLTVPNANLGKETTVKTDPRQMNDEYKHNQDVTAPPDPMAPGSTSDVPIHGEKTNILFHPTPSVDREPTFASIEKQTGGLCIGVLLAIIVVGKIFGGRLLGLIPLGLCITSGIWLWMKELIRSEREVNWDSEKVRGETVSLSHDHLVMLDLTPNPGCCKSAPRIRRMDEYAPGHCLGLDQPGYVRRSSGHSRGCHASLCTWSH